MSMVLFMRLKTLEAEFLKLLSRVEALEEKPAEPPPEIIPQTTALADWARQNQVRHGKKQRV
jgi:hypothetical protein